MWVVDAGTEVIVTTSVVGSMSITEMVRVDGLPDIVTVSVSVTGGEDSTTVVGADVTVTGKVVSASLPCPPPPSIGTIEYVGRAARASAAGVLFQKKGKADDWLHRDDRATSRVRGRTLRCILPRRLFRNFRAERLASLAHLTETMQQLSRDRALEL